MLDMLWISILLIVGAFHTNVIQCHDLFSHVKPKDKYCPISSTIHTSFDAIHSYPMNYFDPSSYEHYLSKLLIKSEDDDSLTEDVVFNCTGTGASDNINLPNICSSYTKCPLVKENIVAARQRMQTWNYSHSFCSLNEHLQDPDAKVNIYILGGSNTFGSASSGCCCTNQFDSKCAAVTSAKIQEKCGGMDTKNWPYSWTKLCTFSSFLSRGLRSLGNGNINVFNLAVPGSNSPIIADSILYNFMYVNVTKLTSADIILIDYSVNDATTYHMKSGMKEIQNGMEKLVRRIYHLSDVGSRPSMVILEHFFRELEYTTMYRKIAQHYHIPIWSYTDMVASPFVTQNQSAYKEFIQFHRNEPHSPVHMPWYLHLYYADFLGAMLLQELRECYLFQQHPIQYSHFNHSINLDFEYALDHAIAAGADADVCTDEPMINMPSHGIMNGYIKPNSNVTSNPSENGWELKDEQKGKTGWVHQFNDPQESITYNLTFPFADQSRLHPHILFTIEYFRTYKNAGVVDFYFCGSKMATLDALWADHIHFKHSFNDIKHIHYPGVFPPWCRPDTLPNGQVVVEFVHSNLPNDPNQQFREKQKFKLVSLKVCHVQL